MPHAGRSQADGDALQELLAKGVLPMLVFRTDDLDATFETVRASGAEVLQEPIDQPWGLRDCAFRDPAGNMVRFSRSRMARHAQALGRSLRQPTANPDKMETR